MTNLLILLLSIIHITGGSRDGAREAWAPLILDKKKEEMTEERKASRAHKSKLPSPRLAQGMDRPLHIFYIPL